MLEIDISLLISKEVRKLFQQLKSNGWSYGLLKGNNLIFTSEKLYVDKLVVLEVIQNTVV